MIGEIDPSGSLIKRFYFTGDVELGDLVLGPEFLSFGASSKAFVWFLERKTGRIGRLNPQTGDIAEWQLSNANARPMSVAIHRYGSTLNNTLFFTEYDGNRIGSIRYVGGQWILKEYVIPTGSSKPVDVDVDNNGLVWFSESETDKIDRFDPWSTEFSEYPVEPRSRPWGIAAKPNMTWFTMSDANRIARLDPRTALSETYSVPTDRSRPSYIKADIQGSLWFTELESGRIGRFSPNCTGFIEYSLPDSYTGPYHISTSKSTGEVWATESRRNGIVRILPAIIGVASTATAASTVQTASLATSPLIISTATLTQTVKILTSAVTVTAGTTVISISAATTTIVSTVTTTQPASTTTLTSTVTTSTTPSRACIIAQAAYGSELAPQVQALRMVRDNQAMNTFAGTQFMRIFNRFYYSFSPQVADVVGSNRPLADITRIILTPLLQILAIVRGETEPQLVSSGLVASALIGLTYFTIPLVMLIVFTRRSRTGTRCLMSHIEQYDAS